MNLMRRHFGLILLIVLCPIVQGLAQSGWSIQPSGTTRNLRGICVAPGTRTVWAVGDSGTILTSRDGGPSWTVVPFDSTVNLTSVAFSYADTGFAVGERGAIVKIQHYADGSSVVTALPTPPIAANKTLRSITTVAISPLLYVVGDSGLTLRSIDRGRTWVAGTVTPPRMQTLRSIYLVDLARIYAAGDSGTILKSTISNQWQVKTPPPALQATNFTSVTFDADTGWITGEGGMIATTRNGGASWTATWIGTMATLRGGFAFPGTSYGQGLGWIVGDSGIVIKTRNNGLEWTRLTAPTDIVLRGIVFVDSLNGWAVGDNGTILRTLTGGEYGPIASIVPSQMEFGPVLRGSEKSANIIAMNRGSAPLDIISASSSNPRFQIAPTSANIPGGGAATFVVNYSPGGLVPDSGIVTLVESGTGVQHTVEVVGTGIDSIRPSGWVWQNPVPSGVYPLAVKFISATTVIAAGDGGTILRSSDAGSTWSAFPAACGLPIRLDVVAAATGGNAFAAGLYGTIIATSDGGLSWRNLATMTTARFLAMSFSDALHGSAVGWNRDNSSFIQRTTDGGATWSTAYAGPNRDLSGVAQINENTTVAVGYGYEYPFGYSGFVLKSTDGGSTWVEHRNDQATFTSVVFTTASNGVAIGTAPGAVYRSSDGGETWAAVNSRTTLQPAAVSFVDPLTGWIAAFRDTVITTTDGGLNWTPLSIGVYCFLGGISFGDAETGIAVGIDLSPWPSAALPGIFRTTDGGSSWSEVTSEVTGSNLRTVSFADAHSGMAVGDKGTVLRTGDGGMSWTRQLKGSLFEFLGLPYLGVATPGAQSAVIVGASGATLRTDDAGSHWTTQTTGTNATLRGVAFSDLSHGWAVGDSGTILQTTDGGANWVGRYGLVNSALEAVSFSDSSRAAIVGERGTTLYTTDGGVRWETANSGVFANLFGVSLHADTGLAVGSAGTILRTTDAGKSWTILPPATTTTLRGVSMVGGAIGTVVGDGGTMLRTTDGGMTWMDQSIIGIGSLYNVWLTDEKVGTAVGGFGTILRTTTGGVLSVGETGNHPSLPERFVLDQNYPNPFNPLTRIRFEVAKPGHVSLKIFDVLGREVATLVDDFRMRGTYVVGWNAGDRASGVYFCRLIAGDLTLVRKMMVVR